jgi:mutator protein MutT
LPTVQDRDVLVMGTAIVRYGRVLAARRTGPEDTRGGWELPGGKVEPGEDPEAAVVREITEELGCTVVVTGHLAGEQAVKPGYRMRVAVAALVAGEPVPREHDAVRWLGPEELDDVAWLPADRPFLPQLREILLDGTRLEGGNVMGAVRIGGTVRRAAGPWTPVVHRLLRHLEKRGLRAAPRALGGDDRGREVLTYLPGRIVDVDDEALTDPQLVDLVRWARELHEAVDDFEDRGPWRWPSPEDAEVVVHSDLAPYNACFEGDTLVGVFDWDLAGPSTALMELAFVAWTSVPLYRPIPPDEAARRLVLIADTYGGRDAREILHAVPVRIQATIDGIRAGVAAGDETMANLTAIGEPEGTERALAGLMNRLAAIESELP